MTKTLIIDGQETEVEDGLTLLQACEQAGAEIPRFCYHERLSIAGNCRMCLVEVVGVPKPVASCAMGVSELPPNRDGSPKVVNTRSATVKKARAGVMEFLLINHPLDCPICDQGGECDLQDQAMAFGTGGSRYDENKRAVEEKYIGPLIKTVMTRCIHCTRCVRFMTEIAGVEGLGLAGRGEDAEITTYLENGIQSEMSANVIDLCPVGALTHAPWAHNARPWELKNTESIDVMDAVGSNIRVDTRGSEVMRILPRNNDAVNEEWISDKTRHVCDGLKTQRLDRPYLRVDGALQPVSWDEAFEALSARLKDVAPSRVGALVGDLAGAEEIFALKSLMDRLGVSNIDCRAPHEALDPALGRASYVFNSTIAGIDDADAILLVGSNPRKEAAVLNARIRGRWSRGGLRIASVGRSADLSYPLEDLGADCDVLLNLASGEHPFCDVLRNAKAPLVIVGAGAYLRPDGRTLLGLCSKIAEVAVAFSTGSDWNAFNVLHSAASRVGALDLGFVPTNDGLDTAGILEACGNGNIDVLYLLGADEFELPANNSAFVIYQGSHGDRGAHGADLILPGAAYTEKNATYVNTEGRVQMGVRAIYPPGEAKEDWKIVRALSGSVGHILPFDTLEALRADMYKAVPHLARIDHIEVSGRNMLTGQMGNSNDLENPPLSSVVDDYYLTNPIARASAIMARLSALAARGDATEAPVAAE